MTKTTAFALAGLGGFNAHGAGFLTAARNHGVVPDLVTATSGQIVLLAGWLQDQDLQSALIDPILEDNPFAQLMVGLLGYPQVFRPAYAEAVARWWTAPGLQDSALDYIADRMLPAQQYAPTRSAEAFRRIADTFNDAAKVDGKEIGVVFNAYDPVRGEAVLFGNDQARRLWPEESAIQDGDEQPDDPYVKKGSGKAEPALLPITAEAVQAALWLSLYGFYGAPGKRIDGAYHRACLVSELHGFDRIFVARPLATGWMYKDQPRNWFDVQDWQSEMWFSVGYKAEVDALRRINSLVRHHKLGPPFKAVELYEIAPEKPAGYFNFFVERKAVFHQALAEAEAKFRKAGLVPAAAANESRRRPTLTAVT